MHPLLIFGAGGHAKSVIAAAKSAGKAPDFIADDSAAAEGFMGVPILPVAEIRTLRSPFRFVVCIGDNSVRREKFEWLRSLGGEPETIIHAHASISEENVIGPGSVFFNLAATGPYFAVGETSIVNGGAVVVH